MNNEELDEFVKRLKSYGLDGIEVYNQIFTEDEITAFEKIVPPDRILVLSPLQLGEDVWQPDKDPAFDRQSVQTSRTLREVYRSVAAGRGNHFLAASDHTTASHADEEHLNAEGHEQFAGAVLEKLRESGILTA